MYAWLTWLLVMNRYVALSRVRSLAGLHLTGGSIHPKALAADGRVLAFYERLERESRAAAPLVLKRRRDADAEAEGSWESP